MKRTFFFLLLLVGGAQTEATVDDSLVVVVLMVKDEAEVIVETIKPLVDGGVKRFLIYDTGSTDGTQQKATEFLACYEGVSLSLVEEEFIDFATSRNRSLDLAEQLFPESTFMIVPDAEWYLQNVEGFLRFCAEEKDAVQHSCYYIPLHFISADGTETLSYGVGRLIRMRTGVRFVGVVHEVLNRVPVKTVPATSYFKHQPGAQGKKKSAERWIRDEQILLKSYEKNPYDARTLFYLGQSYGCLGNWQKAYEFYKKRAAVGGWDEENFITQLRLGDTALQLMPLGSKETCYVALGHYLDAFGLRPQRVESLVRIAKYYMSKDQMDLAFLFVRRAVEIPCPAADILFVEKEQYDFVRYDLLGRCAWYVGEFELGEWAVRKALEVTPDAEYLKRNLKCYTDRTAESEKINAMLDRLVTA